LDIYAAGEQPIPGVHATTLVERIRGASYFASTEAALDAIEAQVEEGDVVITLGAGNVWQAGDRLLARLAPMEANARG
jgi:UDP-N-acetylmuramate--alanine ligase